MARLRAQQPDLFLTLVNICHIDVPSHAAIPNNLVLVIGARCRDSQELILNSAGWHDAFVNVLRGVAWFVVFQGVGDDRIWFSWFDHRQLCISNIKLWNKQNRRWRGDLRSMTLRMFRSEKSAVILLGASASSPWPKKYSRIWLWRSAFI